MRPTIKAPADFATGLLFLAVGLGALFVAEGYPLGRLRSMGPGLFPLLLGGLLALIGVGLALRSLSLRGGLQQQEAPYLELQALRPLFFVLAGLVAFALLVRPFGLALASVTLVLIASRAERGFPLLQTLVAAVAIPALAVGIFAYGLGLPFRVWP